MRKALLAPLLVAALVGCGTDPPTNVTDTTATLKAHGSCDTGETGTYVFQWRKVGYVGWTQQGPGHPYGPCASSVAGQTLNLTENIGGLAPDALYEFRFVVARDPAGPQGATVYYCAKAEPCATSSTTAQTYETFNTDSYSEGEGGDVCLATAWPCPVSSVSVGGHIRYWRHRTHYGVGGPVSESSWSYFKVTPAGIFSTYNTCRVKMFIKGTDPNTPYADDHSSDGNECYAKDYNLGNNYCSDKKKCGGSHYEFWIRLNDPALKWTGRFAPDRKPGFCETNENDMGQDILHCEGVHGSPSAGYG